ncbi:S-adenosyl-L-methionine-dependent methyltransferase, partial [Amanita rubescens]
LRTSVTSYDISMRTPSPVPSVISISSSMRENLLRQEHGRSLNNYSEVYGLPADEEEWVRLEKQYLLMSKLMGKYAPPLDEIMRDEGDGTEQKRCLDLGCGNGSWIIELARDYPNCEAVAVDLVPMQSTSIPLNLRSEVDDINLGLEHFYGDFNVVHASLVGSGIKNYERLVDQISHVLRPGGLIDVMEWDFCIYDVNRNKIPLSLELRPPWMARFIAFVQSAVRGRGGDVDGIGQMETLIQNHPSFEEVEHRDVWFPAVLRPQTDTNLVASAKGIMENNLEFIKSAAPLLLNSGLSPEQLEMLQNNARQELIDGTASHWGRLKRVYARKRR